MSTINLLFELLENADYIKHGAVNLDRIQRATPTEIIDLSTESAELTSAAQMPRNKSPFTHSASLSLGGSGQPCAILECRTKQVDELSQFAAFYSDKVYIHNFLSDLAAHSEDRDITATRAVLADDLHVLSRLRPLIIEGRVHPVTAPESWCPHCFGVRLSALDDFDPQMVQALRSAGRQLRKRFLSEAKVAIEKFGSVYGVEVRAPKDLLEHGFHAIEFSEMPEELRPMLDVRALLARGRRVPLSRRQVEKFGVHKRETATILENVLFECTISQTFGTSFLTERPIHLTILQSLGEGSQQERRNGLIRRHLTSLVPFLDGMDPEELLKLREEEGDSFVLFRQALNRAIDEASDGTGEFTERQARDLYGDVLEPSLARLDLKLRTAQNSLLKSARRKTGAWVGAITFGLFSGLLPASLVVAAKALGLTKVLADLGEAALQSGPDENVIRNEDTYFLWKVRQVSRFR